MPIDSGADGVSPGMRGIATRCCWPSKANVMTYGEKWIEDDDVLDILVRSRWNKMVATTCFRKLLKGLRCVPRLVITDQLKSYSAVNARYCQGWNTGRIATSITGVRTRIGRRANGSGVCRVQISRPCPAFFVGVWTHGPILPPATASAAASAYRQEIGNRFASWAAMRGTKRAA
jgi:hypothetical protein